MYNCYLHNWSSRDTMCPSCLGDSSELIYVPPSAVNIQQLQQRLSQAEDLINEAIKSWGDRGPVAQLISITYNLYFYLRSRLVIQAGRRYIKQVTFIHM